MSVPTYSYYAYGDLAIDEMYVCVSVLHILCWVTMWMFVCNACCCVHVHECVPFWIMTYVLVVISMIHVHVCFYMYSKMRSFSMKKFVALCLCVH